MQSDLIIGLRRHIEQVDSLAPSLEELLAGYVDQETDAVELVEVDYVLEADSAREPEQSAGARWRKRPAVLGAVAAIAILVAATVALVVDRGDDGLVTDSVSQPSVAESPAVSGATDPTEPGWSLVYRGQAGLEGVGTGMSAVVAGGPGVVAVGGRDHHAAVWTSEDGWGWSRVPHDEAVFGGEGEYWMVDVTVGGPGLVAVGERQGCTDTDVAGREDPSTTCEPGSAVVWTSVDGVTWSRVPFDKAVFGGGAMSSVVAGGPGLVAVGRAGGVEVENQWVGDSNAAVWTSVDGLTWSRVPDDEAVFGGPDNQSMADVTVGGPGLVAVGRDGMGAAWDNSPGQNAAVWTSVDGLNWARIPHDEEELGVGGPVMLDVTVGGPGLVATGFSFPLREPGAVWTSVDGLTWSRVNHDNSADTGGSVIAAGPGLLALAAPDELGTTVWTSPDGVAWSVSADPTSEAALVGSGIEAFIEVDGGLIAVGDIELSEHVHAPAVWRLDRS